MHSLVGQVNVSNARHTPCWRPISAIVESEWFCRTPDIVRAHERMIARLANHPITVKVGRITSAKQIIETSTRWRFEKDGISHFTNFEAHRRLDPKRTKVDLSTMR
jgi:hypothetical protein